MKKFSWWPVAIVGFFLVVFIVNGFFLYFAFETNTGMISSNPYEEGVAFQNVIDREERFNKAGFAVDYTLSPAGQHGLRDFGVRLTDKSGALLAVHRLEFIAKRPAADTKDIAVSIKTETAGEFNSSLPFDRPGLWHLEFSFDHEGEKHLYREKTLLP